LPIEIGDIAIKKLEWTDFDGLPDKSVDFQAYTWWYVSYEYDVTQIEKLYMLTSCEIAV
jgi:hypothetical protein